MERCCEGGRRPAKLEESLAGRVLGGEPCGSYASERCCDRGAMARRGSERLSGEPEVPAGGRCNAITLFHRFSAFDHLPVAITFIPAPPVRCYGEMARDVPALE